MLIDKLHIHFGIHRTGTTSIHSTLVSNKNELKGLGILYPDLGVNHRHVRTAWQLLSKKIDGNELVKRIKSEISDDTKKIILSSEDFCQLKDTAWLKALSDNFDLTASVYLRRQDLWLESWYNQHVKWPWDKRFSAATPQFFLSKKNEFYWLDYSWLLSRIETFIAKENIYAQVMEQSSVADTTLDFLSVISIDSNSLEIKKPKNASLTKCQLDILRRIDLKATSPKQRNQIIKALRSIDIDECDGSKAIFTSLEREDILNKYSEINKSVAYRYFNRCELFEEKVKYPEVNELKESLIFKKYFPKIMKELAL